MFITIEGPDGAGKDSVLNLILPQLRAALTVPLTVTREPGGDHIAEQIRELILDPANTAMSARTEALLYAAGRAQHLDQVIEPALERGEVVLCDRFVDSSIVYQGAGRGLGEDDVAAINDFATGHREPDVTLYFDVPAKVGLARIHAHRKNEQFDRLDQEEATFHETVHAAYLRLAAAHPDRIVTIDATQPLEVVAQAALDQLATHLKSVWQA